MTMYFTYAIDPDVYYDIEGLSGTIQMNMPIAISNGESETLYFKVEIIDPPTGYTLYTQNLGSLGAGASGFFVWDFQRDTPTLSADELDEALTIRLTAYTDAGYSVPYGYVNATSTIHFFDSYGASWTMQVHDTFDDGTVSGWAVEGLDVDPAHPANCLNFAGDASHFLSAPYSMSFNGQGAGSYPWRSYKSFVIGAYTKARITLHLRVDNSNYVPTLAKIVGGVTTLLVPYAIGQLVTTGKWVRFVFNLDVNATTKFLIGIVTGANTGAHTWLDEVRVVRK